MTEPFTPSLEDELKQNDNEQAEKQAIVDDLLNVISDIRSGHLAGLAMVVLRRNPGDTTAFEGLQVKTHHTTVGIPASLLLGEVTLLRDGMSADILNDRE